MVKTYQQLVNAYRFYLKIIQNRDLIYDCLVGMNYLKSFKNVSF